jgi:hypothetical protein
MLIIPSPAFFRKRPARVKARKKLAAPLTLVSATFDPSIGRVTLTFDRNIEFGTDWQADQSHLVDGVTTLSEYVGNSDGAGRTDAVFSMIMDVAGEAPEGQVLLSVGSGNGLVAADDGGTWAGCADLVLPWPASEIVSVVHSETDTDRVVVNVSQQFSTIDDPATAFEVSVDGVTWQAPMSMSLGITDVAFIFMGDVSDVTQWRVQHPENWHFADGIPLGAPLSGEIE